MRPGDVITISPEKLVAGGEALARIDGFPVFATGIFPGDVARVRLHEVKKGYAKGELVELLTQSPWRRAAPCPVADDCGGCDWTELRLDRQLEAKKAILVESLRRIGKIDPATLPEIRVHASPLNYRLRSRFHTDGEKTGFFAFRSNRVVPLPPECEVVGPATAEEVGLSRLAPGEQEVWELEGELTAGEDEEMSIHAGGYAWQLSTRSFFQVNRHLLSTMLRLVEGHAARVKQRREAVDLYAGVGFFTLPLARLFDRVVAIEGSEESAQWARRNSPPNVEVIEAAVEQAVEKLERPDFVFIDPPRAGTRPEVVSTIAERTQEMIAWLSCDPVTFSRDASRLIASGWRLSTLDLLDLFPNTHHVETLSSFEREP